MINQKTNIARDDYDQLKAILYNCVRYGPGEQNRAGVADFRRTLRAGSRMWRGSIRGAVSG